jgi:hypothetical protein
MSVEELPLEYDASGGQIWKHTRKSKKLIVQCCVSTMGAGARFPRRKIKMAFFPSHLNFLVAFFPLQFSG